MKIFHLSAECYPAAKVGGLADVVGSLPRYLVEAGSEACVIMPRYRTKWLNEQQYQTVFTGSIRMIDTSVAFTVEREESGVLGFPLYVIDIPPYFDRESIYIDPDTSEGYRDEAERYIGFQKAALQWIKSMDNRPDIVHCHDHHTGLIPFMMTQCRTYSSLESVPTVMTVHNAEYQGIYGHDKQQLLPAFDRMNAGLLDWGGMLNSLAAGLKCCWKITTVSPTYMKELRQRSSGLERLLHQEQQKSTGIINGIDTEVWNPETDEYIEHLYSIESVHGGKQENKKVLCDRFGLDENRPLISFIGRLVGEKGADLLPDLFTKLLDQKTDVSFLVLGTGHPELHRRFKVLSNRFVGFFDASLSYNEELAHQIYAGSDFMIIPSRVEPCGLNQMYAMQYGTVPVVRETGGLKDTVTDWEQKGGHGITFREFTLAAAGKAVKRALALYRKEAKFKEVRKKNMKLDFSWNASANAYLQMYKQLTD